MAKNFTNAHDWFTLSWAMVVWAAHFALIYAASIIFPDQPIARWLALAFTLAAAGALYWLWRRAKPRSVFTVGGLGLAVAAAATTFDAMPALIG